MHRAKTEHAKREPPCERDGVHPHGAPADAVPGALVFGDQGGNRAAKLMKAQPGQSFPSPYEMSPASLERSSGSSRTAQVGWTRPTWCSAEALSDYCSAGLGGPRSSATSHHAGFEHRDDWPVVK